MKEIKRVSPVVFRASPLKTEKRDNWDVVTEYREEGDGPFLVDLSHKPRFDLQDSKIGQRTPFGITLPQVPGESVFENGILANRMNNTQVSLYCLDDADRIEMPDEQGMTDVTEATLFVALIGPNVFSICEKLSSLDFMDKSKKVPFLFQGPFSHVPCQIVTLSRNPENSALVLTCSRGYGRDMIHAILDAGAEFGLAPAGEKRFTDFINTLS